MDANKQYLPASVVPGLQSRKAAALIDYLTGTVGFVEHARFEERRCGDPRRAAVA